MSTARKVSLFAVALLLAFGGAWVAGRAVGPAPAVAGGSGGDGSMAGMGPAGAGHGEAGAAGHAEAGASLPGLAATLNGYTLVAETARLDAGSAGSYRFRIADGSGATLTRFAVEHDKRLHLIVVRRDGAHYRHVHPEMSADGTWSVSLTPPAAGSYRVFADFRPEGGPKTVLGVDLQVAGDFQPVLAAGESRVSTVDGYQVRLDGDLVAGASSAVRATVSRQGEPVTDLQPYLGAYGHLVALRGTDLAYLHVHPEGTPGDGHTSAGPEVRFAVEVPTAGRYLLYLDFQHGDQVRTAEFVLDARVGTQPSVPGVSGSGDDGHGGDEGGHGG